MAFSELGRILEGLSTLKEGVLFVAENRHRFKILEEIVTSLSSSNKRHEFNLYDYDEFNKYGMNEADIVEFMIADIDRHIEKRPEHTISHLEVFRKEPFNHYHDATRDAHEDASEQIRKDYLAFKKVIDEFKDHDKEYMERYLENLKPFKDNIQDFSAFLALEAIEESILRKFSRYEEFSLGLITEEEYYRELRKYLESYKLYCMAREAAGPWNAKGMGGVIRKIMQKNPNLAKNIGKIHEISSDLKDYRAKKNIFTKSLSIAYKVLTHKTTGRLLSITGMVLTVILASFTPAGPLIPLIFLGVFLTFMAISIGVDAYSRYNARQLKKENLLLKRLERLNQKGQDLDKKLFENITKDNFNLKTFQGKKARGAENIELPKIRPQGSSFLKTLRTAYGESATLLVINTGLVVASAPNVVGLVFTTLGMFAGANAAMVEKDFNNMRKDNLKWQNAELKIGTPKYKNMAELERLVEEQQIQNRAKKTLLANVGVDEYKQHAHQLGETIDTPEIAYQKAVQYHSEKIAKPDKNRTWQNVKSYLKEYIAVINPFSKSTGHIYEEDLLSQYRSDRKSAKKAEMPDDLIARTKLRTQDVHKTITHEHAERLRKSRESIEKGI